MAKTRAPLNFLFTFSLLKKIGMNKKLISFAFLLFCITLLSAQTGIAPENSENVTSTITKSGIGLGSVIAVVASWDRNQSIFWAIIHGILGWFYVIFFALTRD